VLFLYALLPIAGNTLAGFRTVPPDAIEAARGMGMTAGQRFWRVELPLAFPVIVSGVRTALTQNIGNALLAGLIGGGGLGALIYLGLAQAAPDLILLGALSVAILALAADRGLEALVRALTPRGIRSGA
jgi:osmoprotectant transport system permease protein